MKLIYITLVFVILFSSFTYAEVGIGISPTKIIMNINEGETQELSLLVFNSGSRDIDTSLAVEGDLAEIVKVKSEKQVILPEEIPHKLPIKNGKNFVIELIGPSVSEPKTYIGTISAVAVPLDQSGAPFGGAVGVATQVELTVMPTGSKFFAFLTTTPIIILGIIILILILIFILWKVGFRFKFERK